MTLADITNQRLNNQQITSSTFTSPADLVSWMGAVQAQDFAAAKWALGLRLPHTTDSAIELAFNKGEILRTHMMRPTWHFVAPNDIRWLLPMTSTLCGACELHIMLLCEFFKKEFFFMFN